MNETISHKMQTDFSSAEKVSADTSRIIFVRTDSCVRIERRH
jgi:hypothetical protein